MKLFFIGKLAIIAVIHHSVGAASAPKVHFTLTPAPPSAPIAAPAIAPAPPPPPPVPPTPPPAPTYPPVSVTANGYEPGQCVWYVKNLRPELPGNWHNAIDWYANAQAMGWPTGATPQVNAVAWEITNHGYGHVALVTAVNGDGTITITEMNEHYIPYQIDSRVTSASLWLYIY